MNYFCVVYWTKIRMGVVMKWFEKLPTTIRHIIAGVAQAAIVSLMLKYGVISTEQAAQIPPPSINATIGQ